jgi:hypothetical protein
MLQRMIKPLGFPYSVSIQGGRKWPFFCLHSSSGKASFKEAAAEFKRFEMQGPALGCHQQRGLRASAAYGCHLELRPAGHCTFGRFPPLAIVVGHCSEEDTCATQKRQPTPVAMPAWTIFLCSLLESRGGEMNATTKSTISSSLTTLPRTGVKQRMHAKRATTETLSLLKYRRFSNPFPLPFVTSPSFSSSFLCAFAVFTRVLPSHPGLSALIDRHKIPF